MEGARLRLAQSVEEYREVLAATQAAQRKVEKAVADAEFELVRAEEGVGMGPAAHAAADAVPAGGGSAVRGVDGAGAGGTGGDGAGEREALRGDVAAARELLPRAGAMSFMAVVGSVNVRMRSEEERWEYKDEYENFKALATQLSFFVTLAVYFLDRPWLDTLLHSLVLYYYTSITLREHVLSVNGSNIRRFWRIHHYLTIVLTAVLLTWPPMSATWRLYRNTFIAFILYISVIQILQYRYQRARLQILRSLGHKGGSDVVNSDTTQLHWSTNMLFLLPFLFVGQFAQIYVGYFLISLFNTDPYNTEWQVPVSGALYLALGAGNIFTTVRVCAQRYFYPPPPAASPPHRPSLFSASKKHPE